MIFMENHLTFCVFISILLLSFLAAIIQVFHQIWWKPMQIQHFLQSQGIKGPPYVFLDGNSTEIFDRKMNSLSRKMQLSDDVFIALQPHVHLWTKIYGKNFLHWPGARAELVVSELELIQELLKDKEGCFYRSENGDYLNKILGGENLADQMLHDEILEKMTPWMVESVEVMVGMWKNHEGKNFDVFEEFGFLSAEVTSRAAFGRAHYEIFHKLMKLMICTKKSYKVRPSMMKMMFKDGDGLEAEKLAKEIRDFVSVIVKKRQSKLGNGEDLLGLLLKEQNDKISTEEIIDRCVVFCSAGQSTVTSMLSWTILLLATHQDWQEKAREEVLRMFSQEAPNSEGISRLKMISMIIKESLRLYPPSVYLERKTIREGAKLGKYILPADISIHVPILAVHHDPKIWGEDAQVFNPERFSDGFAFLPFLGAKAISGANFATLQVKIILSVVLLRYSFTLSPRYVHSPIDVPFLRPQHGAQVILRAL